MSSKLIPSSASTGFFQSPPVLVNQYEDDHVLRSTAETYLSGAPDGKATHGHLTNYGRLIVRPEIWSLIADAERNPPSLSTHSTFGVPRTILNTSHGWKELQDMGIQAGIVATPYVSEGGDRSSPNRTHQFLKVHMWSGSAAMVTCPSAMTDGAATLLRRHLQDKALDSQPRQQKVFSDAYMRLTSFDPRVAWTSGQWMTERSGGSDVRGTETVAELLESPSGTDANGMPLGPWRIDGFKWFSSATDSQMTVLLAKTSKGGLSAFFAPMRKSSPDGTTTMNGVSIQRLKPKLGTRALPTAELVLNDMRGWLIGKEGDGVREISAILNITRIHNAVGAMGHWGRALGITRAYARVRKVEGGLLQDNPAFVRTLARNTVNYAGHMQLAFFVVKMMDITEQSQQSRPIKAGPVGAKSAAALLRFLTPVAKAQCSKEGIYGVQECMESLGGIGYIEDEQEFNIARLYRDCNVLSIWEGTTDVMAHDVVRVLKGRTGAASFETFEHWVSTSREAWVSAEWHDAGTAIDSAMIRLRQLAAMEAKELRVRGRELLKILAWLTSSVLLVQQAIRRKDDLSNTIALQWLALRSGIDAVDNTSFAQDREIAFGTAHGRDHKL